MDVCWRNLDENLLFCGSGKGVSQISDTRGLTNDDNLHYTWYRVP